MDVIEQAERRHRERLDESTGITLQEAVAHLGAEKVRRTLASHASQYIMRCAAIEPEFDERTRQAWRRLFLEG